MARKHPVLWAHPTTHPPYGAAEIDWAHPLTRGLVAWFAPHVDLVSGLSLTPGGGAGLGAFGGRPELAVLAPANNARFAATTPARLNVQPPLSFACRLRLLACPSSNAGFAGIAHNTTVSAPYLSLGVGVESTYYLALFYNDGASTLRVAYASALNLFAASYPWGAHIIGVIPYNAAPTLMVNGAAVSLTGATATTAISYGATSETYIGETWSSQNRNPQAQVSDFQLWNRALSVEEQVALYLEPYAPLRARAPVAYYDLGTAAGDVPTGEVTASVATVAMADGAQTGGELAFTVAVTDAAGDNDVYTGAVRFAAQRKGGAVTCDIGAIGTGVVTKSHAGADLTVLATADVSSGTSVVLKLTADTALAATSFKAYWSLRMFKGHGAIT